MAPIAKRFCETLGRPVKIASDVSDLNEKEGKALAAGRSCWIEIVRFYKDD
jgi:3-phosphoglycerate kinase